MTEPSFSSPPPCNLYRVSKLGEPEALSEHAEPLGPAGIATVAALSAFISHDAYPCVGAKSALAKGSCILGLYSASAEDHLKSRHSGRQIREALSWFGDNAEIFDDGYATFLAVFDDVATTSDEDFERFLWGRLQSIHDADEEPWDPAVSSDTTAPDFRFSAGGHAFFVVGLHPHAEREARRFPYPTLVFNLHEQFEKLREQQKFERMRTVIRDREEDLQGEKSPYLADHGEVSEAHQYAGVPHDAGWKPPFTQRGGTCPFKRDLTPGKES